ncbi:hypothetical protein BGX27_001829 [Mortierella sp. AM989]|nr:hypothetical protein BGX27_001829 [Mortierella sp. AM989]
MKDSDRPFPRVKLEKVDRTFGGDYGCGSPVKLGQNLLSYIPSVAKLSFTILAGDIPPHDAWLETHLADNWSRRLPVDTINSVKNYATNAVSSSSNSVSSL